MYKTIERNLRGTPVHEVSVNEARQNFKELLNRAADGDEIMIVRHGRPIAKLSPPPAIRRPLPDLTDFRKSITYTGKPLSQMVIEEREKDRC